jgi:hypothetical protein
VDTLRDFEGEWRYPPLLARTLSHYFDVRLDTRKGCCFIAEYLRSADNSGIVDAENGIRIRYLTNIV